MLEKGPQTLKETSFQQAYGNDLNEAKKWCSRYKLSGNIRDLNQAWDLYYQVFRRISRQVLLLFRDWWTILNATFNSFSFRN